MASQTELLHVRDMHYVYLLRSLKTTTKTYIGFTDDLKARFHAHNQGLSPHMSNYCPWELVAYMTFTDRQRALDFERYLKRGSGHAFARRHFW